ncbi:nucleotide disphospho-sugar-binding domain-containing protein [Microbacterium sp. KR10-403]|uniref:glycosyltransferase n=1 Tax=Microbacterium sp. KR10-403 TaxID=3158581 RepID=UPI0032E44E5C
MARILVAAMSFTGHVAPVLTVAHELVAAGHDVRVYTGSAFAARVAASGARFVPWREATDFDENDLQATFPRLVGKKGLRQTMVNLEDCMIGTAGGQVADLEAEWRREPWDVTACDEMALGPGLFAERHDVPLATIAVLPLHMPSRQGPPSGLGLTPGTNALTRLRDAALRSAVPLMAGPLDRPFKRLRRELGLPTSRLHFNEIVLSRRLIVANGSPALDFGRTDRPPHLHFVGALTADAASRPVPEWWSDLDDRRVIVVTQGTQNVDPSDLVRPALDALADEDALVVATTGLPGRNDFDFAVPANARVADFVPFALLLPRTDVMITNGGWGGTLAGLSHGVPLVIAGGDLDKPEVAARVAWSGAGVNLRTGTPTSAQVAEGYRRARDDVSVRDAAARVGAELRSLGGPTRAAALIAGLADDAAPDAEADQAIGST